MDELEKYLIIGLGNPGASYKKTRHNVGFHIVQLFAEKQGMAFKVASHLSGDLAQGSIRGKKVFTLMPTTYMNLSGEAVRRCIDYFKVPLSHVIVVCDDVALPIGTLRMRSQGSCGGHNGLRSIEAHLNTQYYARLKVGVGAPNQEDLADYVLGRFSDEESKVLEGVSERAMHVLELWVAEGIAKAMQAANVANDQVKKEEGDKNG